MLNSGNLAGDTVCRRRNVVFGDLIAVAFLAVKSRRAYETAKRVARFWNTASQKILVEMGVKKQNASRKSSED